MKLWESRSERERREADLDRELRSHLDLEAEEQRDHGLNDAEARYAALRAFGNRTLIKEVIRDMWGGKLLHGFSQDLRYALRALRQNFGFTLVAVITLGLGIGANTAMFSVINAVFLRPLPFRAPDRLVQLWETESSPGDFPLTGPDYMEWEKQTHTLEGTSLYSYATAYNMSGSGEPRGVSVVATEANFFSVLGVPAFAGRTFAPGEDQPGKNHIAVLTYAFWKASFGSREAVNKTIELNGEPYTIVGILPPWYQFGQSGGIFVPMDMSSKNIQNNGSHQFRAIARMKPQSSVAGVRSELSTIEANFQKRLDTTQVQVIPSQAIVIPLAEQLTGNSRPRLMVLFGAVALVLLVACANIANLLLARATRRQREVALRSVLGASRWRLVRGLLTESVVLSLAGAILGLAGAWWAVALMSRASALPVPRANPIQIDPVVLGFTVVVSVLVGVLFGLAPALQAAQLDLGEELKASALSVVSPARWQRFLRDVLVVGEIAVSLALLTGAGLLLRSFGNLCNADIGVQSDHVMTMGVMLPPPRYAKPAARQELLDRFLDRIQHIPGIESAAFSSEIPTEGGNNGYITIDGDNNPAHRNQLVENNYITPDYFKVFGIPQISGRNLSAADLAQTNDTSLKLDEYFEKNPKATQAPAGSYLVAVISRKMADTFWPGQDPVGKIFNAGIPVKVIGVVGDVRQFGVQTRAIPQAYYGLPALYDWPVLPASIVVRTSAAPESIMPAVRSSLRDLDGSLALVKVRTMEQVLDDSVQGASVQTWLLGSFAALAMLLAAVGLYSVLSYLVAQRTREIGIRMALGARRQNVFRLVMTQAARLTAAGVMIGVVAALALTRLMGSLLYGVTARDPLTFGSVVIVLALVALLAAYIPVRRAMRVDPMVALRYE